MYPNIEKRLGLHQELQIIYVVDGYEATLYKDDDCTEIIAQDNGLSIADALDNLDATLEGIKQ